MARVLKMTKAAVAQREARQKALAEGLSILDANKAANLARYKAERDFAVARRRVNWNNNLKQNLKKNRHAAWRRWGLDPKEVDAFLVGKTCCDICGSSGKLVVDHDHRTLKIRGVLCNRCNVGIGMLNDSVDLLMKAAWYLEKDAFRESLLTK